jgi:ribosomal RNA methyltransferase Nop2
VKAHEKQKLKVREKRQKKYQSDESSEEEESENEIEQMQSDEEDVQAVQASLKKGFKAAVAQKKTKAPVEDSDDDESEPEADDDDGSSSAESEVMRDDFGESDDDEEEEEEQEKPSNKRKRDILAESDDDSEDQDDDDDSGDGEEGSDSDSDSEAEMKMPIEKAGKKLRKRKEEDDQLAEEELQLNIADREEKDHTEMFDIEKVLNLQDVQQRISDVGAVLNDFSFNRDPSRSRSDYMDVLKKDLCTYYSYNEFLMERLMDIFAVAELMQFLEASEVQRPLTLRTNTLKTRRRDLAQALINRGVNLDPIGKWSKVGLVIYNSQVPLGATPEYLAGHYIIQGGSSMLPVMALAPQENERILDMCAAPGGKSTHIAAIMKNTGVLFSNDLIKDRIHAIVGNFHRLGIVNSVVTCVNGVEYKRFMGGFDRVLLDAPCTGTGVISKDESVKTSKTQVDIQRCYNLQRKLILSAIDCVTAKSKSGGYLVYSTCSILPEENEWVVDYALKKRNVRLVPTGLEFGEEGLTSYQDKRYHPSMKLTRRFYPHKHNLDGFFVAKLQKFSDEIPNNAGGDDIEKEVAADDELQAAEEVDESKKKKRVDKRDWFQKDLSELNEKKKPVQDTRKQNYVTNVFEKPVKREKSKDTKPSTSPIKNGKKEETVAVKPTPSKRPATNGKEKSTPAKSGKQKSTPATNGKQKSTPSDSSGKKKKFRKD